MIFIVYGTRAELIKFSPLIRELKRRKIKFSTVDTGQHDNDSLHKSLGLPRPDFHLGKSYRSTWSGLESTMVTYPMASMLALLWGVKVFVKLARIVYNGDIVVTHGNAMGVPLAIYAARLARSRPHVVHMESGFRAGTGGSKLVDFIYRFTDKRSDYLFTPFKSSRENLKSDDIMGRIVVSGDVMKDVVKQTLRIAPKSKPPRGKYVVVNMTRSIVTKHDAKHFMKAMEDSPVKTVLVLNPVIRRRLEKFGFSKDVKRIGAAEPMDYPDFLHLLNGSIGAVTDSTGVQEECAVLGKPCISTNDFLQIPELREAGIVRVVGTNYMGILRGLVKMTDGSWKVRNRSVMGSGSPTKLIADHIVALQRSRR